VGLKTYLFIYFSLIPSTKSITLKIDTNACQGSDTEVNYLEHVQAVISIVNVTRRGDIEMFLTSPMGTRYDTLISPPNSY
jgi:proprotein convertase subtilisin/kexin type 2